MNIPTFSDVVTAHARVEQFAHRTPVLTSESINHLTGAKIHFKCENFQKAGAFKFRGATNAVLSLSNEEAAKRCWHPFFGKSWCSPGPIGKKQGCEGLCRHARECPRNKEKSGRRVRGRNYVL